jgi:putative FmdB family regulatory protein
VPTYQYACTECGDRSEVVQRFSDDPLTVCTACGGRLRKIFSPVGIVFKGSGFYRTDSRNGASSVSAAKESAANGSNGSSSDSSSASSDGAKNGSASSDSGSSKSSADAGGDKKSGSGDKKSSSVSTSASS